MRQRSEAMKHAANYTLFLAIGAMLTVGGSYADAAPSWKSRSNMQRSGKSSYTSSSRKIRSQSKGTTHHRKNYSAGNNYKNRTGSKSNNNRRYVTKPQPNHKGEKYNVHPKWDRKSDKQTIKPDWPRKGSKTVIYPGPKITGPKITGPKITGPKITGPKITGPKITGPKITGPKITSPSGRTFPDIRNGGRKFNPQDIQTLPKMNNLSKGLKDFLEKGNKAKNQADLNAVRNFANKCIRNPVACGWWVDFCCHHWWDYCCYPNYWNCWDHCYWNTVYCPSQVVVVGGVQQVLQDVSYYLGISGSQIPNFGFGIQQVKTSSPAERAGLKQGDVIVSINGQEMTGQEILATTMQQTGGVLDLEVVAQGSETPRMVRVVAEQIQTSNF
jgi:hypothetical protein